MEQLLVIDHRVATPDRDAGSLRMVHLIELLAELGFEVTYLPASLRDPAERQRLARLAASLPLRLPAERSVKRHLRRNRDPYRVVILCRVGTAHRFLRPTRRACPGAAIVFDTVDLHFLRQLGQSEIEGDPSQRAAALDLRRRELAVVRATDATLAASSADAEVLRRHCPQARIYVLPTLHRIVPPRTPFEQRHGLVFIAGFEHAPNVDAAKWLVREIAPGIQARLPQAVLSLVGSDPPPEVQALRRDRIEVTGYVPELEPVLERARLSLAPLRFGAGVKGKITQSLAVGLPVVATRLACRGMSLIDGQDILMADEPEAFAAAAAEAYLERSLWQRLSTNGLRVATRYFSFDAAGAVIARLLRDLEESDSTPPDRIAEEPPSQ